MKGDIACVSPLHFSPLASLLPRLFISPPLLAWGLYLCLYCLVERVGAFYEFDQFVNAFVCACESPPLSVSAVSEDVSVSLVDFAVLGDVLAGLECDP